MVLSGGLEYHNITIEKLIKQKGLGNGNLAKDVNKAQEGTSLESYGNSNQNEVLH